MLLARPVFKHLVQHCTVRARDRLGERGQLRRLLAENPSPYLVVAQQLRRGPRCAKVALTILAQRGKSAFSARFST